MRGSLGMSACHAGRCAGGPVLRIRRATRSKGGSDHQRPKRAKVARKQRRRSRKETAERRAGEASRAIVIVDAGAGPAEQRDGSPRTHPCVFARARRLHGATGCSAMPAVCETRDSLRRADGAAALYTAGHATSRHRPLASGQGCGCVAEGRHPDGGNASTGAASVDRGDLTSWCVVALAGTCSLQKTAP